MEGGSRSGRNRKGRPSKASSQKHLDRFRAQQNEFTMMRSSNSPDGLTKGRLAMDAKWLISPEDEQKLIEAIRSSRDCGDLSSQSTHSGSFTDSSSIPPNDSPPTPSLKIGHIPWGILMCLPSAVTSQFSGFEHKSSLLPVSDGPVSDSASCTLSVSVDSDDRTDTSLSPGKDTCQSDYSSDLVRVFVQPTIPVLDVVREEPVLHGSVPIEATPIRVFVGHNHDSYSGRDFQRCSYVGELSSIIDSAWNVFRCCGSLLSFCTSVVLWPFLCLRLGSDAIS